MRHHPLKYAKGVPYGYVFNREAPLALPGTWKNWYLTSRRHFRGWWEEYYKDKKR